MGTGYLRFAFHPRRPPKEAGKKTEFGYWGIEMPPSQAFLTASLSPSNPVGLKINTRTSMVKAMASLS